MKYSILISFLIFSGAALAAKEVPISSSLDPRSPQSASLFLHACEEPFAQLARAEGSLNGWIEQAPSKVGEKAFRTPTNELGRWLELTVSTDGLPTVYRVTKVQTTKISFDSKCTQKIEKQPGLDFRKSAPDRAAKWFDDEDLKKLMKSSVKGIIYVWSPGMIYSARYSKFFRDVAGKLRVRFQAVVDPRIPSSAIPQSANQFGIPTEQVKLNSVEMLMRNTTVHYPTTLVFKNGKIHPEPIVGVMSKEDLEEKILKQLSEI